MDEFFYYNTLKTYITAFGNVFNNIKVKHGNENIRLVPIRYASKEKFVEFLMDQAGQTAPYYEQTVPVMAYEMTEVSYDATRKINTLQERFFTDSDGIVQKVMAPNPFNLTFQLSIFTRYGEEMLQIVEQILPFFQPSFNITIKECPELGILERDVPILLTGIASENVYVGSKDERRHIEWTLTFEVKAWLYPNGSAGDGKSHGVINRVIIDFGTALTAQTFTGIDLMADPFVSSAAEPHTIRDATTYSEIFTGDGVPSINLPTISDSAVIIDGLLTITEEQKQNSINSYNYFAGPTTYNQYCEADVRWDIPANGRIILATRATQYAGYVATVNTLDGSVDVFAQNDANDRVVLGNLPAGTVKSTDEVRIEARQDSPTEDSVLVFINNKKLLETSVPMTHLQLSKVIAVAIASQVSNPATAVGIKWLRVGSYAK